MHKDISKEYSKDNTLSQTETPADGSWDAPHIRRMHKYSPISTVNDTNLLHTQNTGEEEKHSGLMARADALVVRGGRAAEALPRRRGQRVHAVAFMRADGRTKVLRLGHGEGAGLADHLLA